MADEIDLANDLIANEVSRALNKIRESTAGNVAGAKFCVECEDDIPAGRRKLGFSLCVSCAEGREREKKLYNS